MEPAGVGAELSPTMVGTVQVVFVSTGAVSGSFTRTMPSDVFDAT